MRELRNLGTTDRDYDRMNASLSKRFGKPASPADTAWGLFNEAITRTHDPNDLKMVYYSMALFLHREGRDCFEMLRRSKELELKILQHSGVVDKVQILPTAGCDACKRQHGRVLTINEALRRMPLPCTECTTKLYDSPHSFCRCVYGAELD